MSRYKRELFADGLMALTFIAYLLVGAAVASLLIVEGDGRVIALLALAAIVAPIGAVVAIDSIRGRAGK